MTYKINDASEANIPKTTVDKIYEQIDADLKTAEESLPETWSTEYFCLLYTSFSSELPNGWSIRFSASPHFDKNKQPLEEGIAPDVAINMSKEDQLENKDTLIEKAFEILSE